MRPIKEYADLFAGVGLTEYVKGSPPSVLVTDILRREFLPIHGQPGDTQERICLSESAEARRPDQRLLKVSAYMVYPLTSVKKAAGAALLVGCARHCDVRIEEASVSREHAWIAYRGDACYIKDNSSTTGTFINDIRLEPDIERKLAAWHRVRLGRLELTYFDAPEFYRFVKRFSTSWT